MRLVCPFPPAEIGDLRVKAWITAFMSDRPLMRCAPHSALI
jgi:hypothetical protein